MRIQKITENVLNVKNLNHQKQNFKNTTVPTQNIDNLTFTGSKIDLVRKIFKPAVKNIDEAMNTGMKKLNLSSDIALERLTPKLEPGAYTKLLVAKIQATDIRIKTLEEAIATQVKPAKVREAEADFIEIGMMRIKKANIKKKLNVLKRRHEINIYGGLNGCQVVVQNMMKKCSHIGMDTGDISKLNGI